MKNLMPRKGLQASRDIPISGSPTPGRVHLVSFRCSLVFFLLFFLILGGHAFESDPRPNRNPISTTTTSTSTIGPGSSLLPSLAPIEESETRGVVPARLRELGRLLPARRYLRPLRAHPYAGGRTDAIRPPPPPPPPSFPRIFAGPVQRPRVLSPPVTTPRAAVEDEGDQVVPDILDSPSSGSSTPTSSSLPADTPFVPPPLQAEFTPRIFPTSHPRPGDTRYPGARVGRPPSTSPTSSGTSAGPLVPPSPPFPGRRFPPFLFPSPAPPTSGSPPPPPLPSQRIPGAGGGPQHIPFYVAAARLMNRSASAILRSSSAPLVVSGTSSAPPPESIPQLYAVPYASLNIARPEDPSPSQLVPSEAVVAQGRAHLHVFAGGDPLSTRERQRAPPGMPVLVATTGSTMSRNFDRAVPDIDPATPSDPPSPDHIIPPADTD